MMDDYLRGYLATAASPETLYQIEEAHRLYVEAGVDPADVDYTTILMTLEMVDIAQPVDDIIALTRNTLCQILIQFGVTPTEDLTLVEIMPLLDALLRLPDYETPEDIHGAFASEDGSRNQLATALSYVMTESVIEILPWLEKVDKGLIVRLAETLTVQDTLAPAVNDIEERRAYITAVIELRQAQNNVVMVALRNGLPVGLPFYTYLAIPELVLDQTDQATFAISLVLVAAISQEGLSKVRESALALLEAIVTDLNQITRASVAITQLLTDLEIHRTSGTRSVITPISPSQLR